MNENKHTPGPWRVTLGYSFMGAGNAIDNDTSVKVGSMDTLDVVVGDKGWDRHGVVCKIAPTVGMKNADGTMNGEDVANAHLIAAAPELLAACKIALVEIEAVVEGEGILYGPCRYDNKIADPRDVLRAAIAKAEK